LPDKIDGVVPGVAVVVDVVDVVDSDGIAVGVDSTATVAVWVLTAVGIVVSKPVISVGVVCGEVVTIVAGNKLSFGANKLVQPTRKHKLSINNNRGLITLSI
jgi:hypothetical protein